MASKSIEQFKAQIPLRRFSPKLHRHKPSRHVEMFVTKFVTSQWQTRLCCSNGI